MDGLFGSGSSPAVLDFAASWSQEGVILYGTDTRTSKTKQESPSGPGLQAAATHPDDAKKTKKQLIDELIGLRQQVSARASLTNCNLCEYGGPDENGRNQKHDPAGHLG